MNVLPYQSEKVIPRSLQDKESIQLLKENTVRVDTDGVQRYTTPLVRVRNMPCLYARKEAVLPQLREIEESLEKDPDLAATYQEELANSASLKCSEAQSGAGGQNKRGLAHLAPHSAA